MRKTGRFLVLLFVVGLSLSLAACVQKPDVTTASGGENVTTGGNIVPTTSGDSAPTTAKPIVLDIDLTAPWTVADVEGSDRAAFSDVGYYYCDNGILHFLDTENGISVVLCYKAGCKHNDDECDAYLGLTLIVFYSDGYVYYDKSDKEDPNSIHVFRRKADGTAEEKIAVLGQDYFSPNISIGVGEYLATEGALYFTVYTIESVQLEDGSSTVMERDGILLRFDLKSGRQEEILRKRDTLIRLFGARNDAVLFYTQDKLPAEDIGELDYYERMESLPTRLQVWSEPAGGCLTLFEKLNKECTWILGLQGGKLYYTDDKKYYTYDLATDTYTTLDWTEYYVLVNENYLLDQDGDTPEGEIRSYSKFVDVRTGQFVPSAYDDTFMRMLNISDRGCVVEITYQGEPIPNGSGSYIIPRLRQITAYVAFTALEDGLQESDLLVIKDETFDK